MRVIRRTASPPPRPGRCIPDDSPIESPLATQERIRDYYGYLQKWSNGLGQGGGMPRRSQPMSTQTTEYSGRSTMEERAQEILHRKRRVVLVADIFQLVLVKL